MYNRETAPLIEWYEKQGLLIHVEIKKGMLEVPRIIQKIQKHLKHILSLAHHSFLKEFPRKQKLHQSARDLFCMKM